jgi:hypothetical protein
MTAGVTLHTVCSPSADVVARDIEGDLIIVPLVAGIGDADDELYTLNATGRAVWDLLDGTRTLSDVVAHLTRQYGGPEVELQSDVLGFATEMVRRGLLSAKG